MTEWVDLTDWSAFTPEQREQARQMRVWQDENAELIERAASGDPAAVEEMERAGYFVSRAKGGDLAETVGRALQGLGFSSKGKAH